LGIGTGKVIENGRGYREEFPQRREFAAKAVGFNQCC
jgi:hypothetical protein